MKVLALNDKGQLTECSVPPEERGKGRCNHIDHQKNNESCQEFIKRINEQYEYSFEKSVIKGHGELLPYRMTDEEKQSLVEIKGKKQLKDENNEGGFISLKEPLWNDMDKNYFSKISKISVKSINEVLSDKKSIVTFVHPLLKKYRVGQVFDKEVAKGIKEECGDYIEFDSGVKGFNDFAKYEYGFEATKDIYVLPYYLRQDPPDGQGENSLNTLYNYLIYNRNNPDKQQLAYESLLDNKNANKPITQRGGYPIDALSDMFKGKSGLMRGYMSGRKICYSGRAVIEPDIDTEYGTMKIPCAIASDILRPSIEDIMQQEGKSKEEIDAFLKGFKIEQSKIKSEDREELRRLVKLTNRRIIANRQPSLHASSLLSFKADISSDATIKMNPLNCEGYGADFDGDTLTVYALNDINISEKSKEFSAESISGTRRPRAQNLNINRPSKESLWGLYNILTKRSN